MVCLLRVLFSLVFSFPGMFVVFVSSFVLSFADYLFSVPIEEFYFLWWVLD